MTTRTRVSTTAPSPTLATHRWDWATILWSGLIFVLPMYRVLPSSGRLLWFASVFALFIGSAIVWRLARPRYPVIWMFAGVASVFALLTATNAASVESNLAIGGQLAVLLGLGVFVMTANAERSGRFVTSVSLAFVAGQTLSSLAGIAQVTGRSVFGRESIEGRASGLAQHPNTLGMMATIALLLCVSMLLLGTRHRLLVLAITVINIGGLMATGSLSSLLAAALGVGVLLVAMRDRIKHLFASVVAIGMALLFVTTFTDITEGIRSPIDRYMQVTGQTSDASTWEIRERTYDFAWEHIKEQPFFGNGLAAKFGGTFNGVTVTHNVFLRAWYQGGILLAVAIALILAAVVVVAVQAMVHKTNGAPAAILVAMMGFALTSAFFEQPDYWIPALVAWSAISVGRGTRRTSSIPVVAR